MYFAFGPIFIVNASARVAHVSLNPTPNAVGVVIPSNVHPELKSGLSTGVIVNITIVVLVSTC